jgi:hypothetical protein
LATDLALAGLARGEGTTLLMVLLTGLAWLDWLVWLEWLVFGLVGGFFAGLVLLALGVLAFSGLDVDGLMVDSLFVGPWPGRRTE